MGSTIPQADLFGAAPAARSKTDDPRPSKPKPAQPPKAVPTSLAVIPPKPKAKEATRRELKLVEASAEIAGARPDGDELAFMHTIMCQVGLPRSKV